MYYMPTSLTTSSLYITTWHRIGRTRPHNWALCKRWCTFPGRNGTTVQLTTSLDSVGQSLKCRDNSLKCRDCPARIGQSATVTMSYYYACDLGLWTFLHLWTFLLTYVPFKLSMHAVSACEHFCICEQPMYCIRLQSWFVNIFAFVNISPSLCTVTVYACSL